jgi:hypothetical protein
MATFQCSMLVQLWSFSCFFIQDHTVDWIEVRWVTRPPNQLDLRPVSCWASIASAVRYCPRKWWGNKFILPGLRRGVFVGEQSNFVHIIDACTVGKKIWGLYLWQEKSYQHIKTGQYFPLPLYYLWWIWKG